MVVDYIPGQSPNLVYILLVCLLKGCVTCKFIVFVTNYKSVGK